MDGRRKDSLRATQPFQFCGGVFGIDVDVAMRAKGQRIGARFLATPYGDGPEPHPTGILNRHMAQTADPENGDRIPACAPQDFSALKVASPAQRIGAASSDDRSSGIATRPLARASIISA